MPIKISVLYRNRFVFYEISNLSYHYRSDNKNSVFIEVYL